VKFGSDFGGRAAIAGALKDLALAGGKRIFLGIPNFSGERRIDGAETGVDMSNSFRKFAHRTIFEQIATGSGVKRAAQVTGTRESSEDDHVRSGLGEFEIGCQFEAGTFGHFDIGNDHIRSMLAGKTEGLAAIAGLGNHEDVRLEVKKGSKGSAKHGLIFGEQNANRRCRLGRDAHDAAT
jgi:hypothetical protein